MRIERLFLEDYKNLVGFEVDFDETSPRQVIVGRNGVGKSNLLEAITRIFRDLDLEEDSEFAYEIYYFCNGHSVRVKSSGTASANTDAEANLPRRFKRDYWIGNATSEPTLIPNLASVLERLPEAEFYRRNRPIDQQPNPDRLLPLYVFGYYSGAIARFGKIFEKHEEKYYKEQITGAEAPLRPLFQAKPNHSQFALLAFYATDDSDAQKFLETEFRMIVSTPCSSRYGNRTGDCRRQTSFGEPPATRAFGGPAER
jgi:AAA ATPase domain